VQDDKTPRVGVLVVAYNAETTLEKTLDRLPPSFVARVDHVLVSDDASTDDTYHVSLRYQQNTTIPITVIKHEQNLGYGGNQKVGYRWAIDRGLDVVVLLHGDGQYAPEVIESLIEPAARGEADAVFGSRMMVRGDALSGGMPLYKYVGNRILTRFQNTLSGMSLTEWHSGYRVYRTDALANIDFESYSDGFDFDSQIILGLHGAGMTVAEVPIPTYYGDEICYVNGMTYARQVATDAVRFRLDGLGIGGGRTGVDRDAYELKVSKHSSHGVLLDWLKHRPASRVLDVGCSDGQFGALVAQFGHEVTGVDLVKHPDVGNHLHGFVEADLNRGLPTEAGSDYDVIVAADVLEHVIDPAQLLEQMVSRLRPGGKLLVSVPNVSHWYPRLRIASGNFGYDQRGPLDQGHVRFFTRRSLNRMIRAAGLRPVRTRVVGSPLDIIPVRGIGPRLVLRLLGAIDRRATRVWPTMFGYQFLQELERA
jgi:glycosyltransferase involved in cell wall biosynthesis